MSLTEARVGVPLAWDACLSLAMKLGEGHEASSPGVLLASMSGHWSGRGLALMAVRVASAWPAGWSSLGQGDFLSLHCKEFPGFRSTDLLLANPLVDAQDARWGGAWVFGGRGGRAPGRTRLGGGRFSAWAENMSPSICTWPFQLWPQNKGKEAGSWPRERWVPLRWLL